MQTPQIMLFFNTFFSESGKINRLSFIRIRPEDSNIFAKGILNTSHYLYKRKSNGKHGMSTIVEGDTMEVPSINMKEFDNDLLNDCSDFLLNTNKIVDVTVFFKDNECGIFMIEKRL